MEKVLVSWSSGKDCALALYEIQKSQKYEISGLLTTVTEDYDRVSMHGVRRILIERQAKNLGLPLKKVFIPKNASNEEYDSRMQEKLSQLRKAGISAVVFGDIFLEGVRKYREENLSRIEMKGVFPLWGRNTAEVVQLFLDLGFKAIVTCVNLKVLNEEFAGAIIDKQFLTCLPPNVDPCGENGEFHSFVFDGPIFKERVLYKVGEVVFRDSFCFCDLVPNW